MINEIRETLQGVAITDFDGVGILTKRINLKKGYRHQVNHIDVFNDMGLMWQSERENDQPVGYQLYVSPYPMQVNKEEWGTYNYGLTHSGAMAGDDNVLYKGMGFTSGNRWDTAKQIETEFPNEQLAGWPTFLWYTDHLYITCIVFNKPNIKFPVKFSLYMSVQEKKCNKIEHQMGVYQEMLDAQCRLLTNTAVTINPQVYAGNNWPMWRQGGIRPELMINAPLAMQYYSNNGYGDAENMDSVSEYRFRYTESRKMVDYNKAFGNADLDLPDWINLFDITGIFAGSLRPQFPPLKKHDNGNTMML